MALRNKLMQMLAGCAALILAAACGTVDTGHNGGGRNLTPPLEGTSWILESINGQPAITIRSASLSVENGRIFGSASCNKYFGSYTGNTDGKFSIGGFRTHYVNCNPDEIMAQERKFKAILTTADRYSVEGNKLTLKAADGKTAIFVNKIQ